MRQVKTVAQVKLSVLGMTLVILVFVAGKPMMAQGATLRVENNGVDSSLCGRRHDPCRSISQAILNASDGDQLLVGPGRYGELNGDADFDDPGEEAANPICGDLNTGGVICIDKRVTVLSRHGAESTVIDAGRADVANLVGVVAIRADGVIFGRKKRGFTITGGPVNGLIAQNNDNVTIAGNVISNNGKVTSQSFGVFISGDRGQVLAVNNVVTNNNSGGVRVVGSDMGKVSLIGNTASGNRGSGFNILGDAPHVMLNNVASGNRDGFTIFGEGYTVNRNTVTGNNGPGFGRGFFMGNPGVGTNGNHTFQRNTVTGNLGVGFFFAVSGINNTVNRNNIFGNATNASIAIGSNCGLANATGQTIDATNNFWGLDSGPGEDPADNAGPNSGCDIGTGSTVVEPFAKKPFGIFPPGRGH